MEGCDLRLEFYFYVVKFFIGEGGIWIRVIYENVRCVESECFEYVGFVMYVFV